MSLTTRRKLSEFVDETGIRKLGYLTRRKLCDSVMKLEYGNWGVSRQDGNIAIL
jgi:hypothetical protein